MLGRVETKDILSLARSGIDGANMFAPLHFPNRRYYAVLLDGVIGDIFRRGLSRRTLACCISRAFNRRALIVRHFYSNTPLRTSSACLVGLRNCCTRLAQVSTKTVLVQSGMTKRAWL